MRIRRSYKYGNHPTRSVRLPDGGRAWIDVEIIPLIRAVWRHGFTTQFSCQGDAGHRTQLVLDGAASAEEVAALAGLTFLSVQSTENTPFYGDPSLGMRRAICEVLYDEWGPRSILWFSHELVPAVTERLTALLKEKVDV